MIIPEPTDEEKLALRSEYLLLLSGAIAASVSARVAHDATRRAAACEQPFTLSSAYFVRGDFYLEDVIKDPVRKALRAQLKDLGQRVFEFAGSTDLMRGVAETVAELDPPRWHRRINIIDKAWDGVGHARDWWVA